MIRALFLFAFLGFAAHSHAITPALSAGARHALALNKDGTVRAWGDDRSGQLGVGRLLRSTTPRAVTGVPRMRAISAGFAHALAVTSDGTVWTWGFNGNGQLGDGTTTTRSTPRAIVGLANVVAVSGGSHYSLALRSDGSVWAWGGNADGQLGDGTQTDRASPVPISGLSAIVAISAGEGHSLALRSDGTVWAWGGNVSGELGDGTTISRLSPVQVAGLSNAIAIAAGKGSASLGGHSLALKGDGSVWAWGDNFAGRLGDGTTIDRALPVQVVGLQDVAAISAAEFTSYALKSDGTAWGWGSNVQGQIGNGTPNDSYPTPTQASGFSGGTAISAGLIDFVIVLKRDGTVSAWGYNNDGELGDGTRTERRAPVAVAGLAGITAIAAGGTFALALASDGSLRAWGDNFDGQLAVSDSTRSTPGQVATLTGVAAIAAGAQHSVALLNDGTVWSWGDNFVGQLVGQRGIASQSAPAQVPGLSGIVAISAGTGHSLAVRSDGTVLAWGGAGACGFALGTLVTLSPSTPVNVPGLPAIAAVASGSFHNAALTSSGEVWTWGCNGSGQLGDGTRASRAAPSRVAGLPRIVAVTAGDSHTLAIGDDGSLWAWGSNASGQLGDGSLTDRLTPIRVPVAFRIAAAAGGNSHSLAAAADGSVWAWGGNGDAQLGDGTTVARLSPIAVPGITGAITVAATMLDVAGGGTSSSLALLGDGSVRAWGANPTGQLGDGTYASRTRPAVVLHEDGTGNLLGNDWYLDLDPTVATTIPADSVPLFRILASGAGSTFAANLELRPQDVGTTGSVYVFALAPSSMVKGAVREKSARFGAFEKGEKDGAVQCVLAQLNAAGQLQAVSASNLQAYVSGVLAGQIQAVTIIDGVPAAQIGGATFYLGYGSNSGSMFTNGTNRSAVSVPGSTNCQPQAPQKGWWWNPAEGGRGYSIEVNGNHLFYAAYLYDVSGRATWLITTGNTSLDGSLYVGDLLSFAGGQTLGGTFPGFPPSRNEGAVTLAFNDASHGTMIWPGGSVPMERFDIVPNGLTLAPLTNQPEGGWWWNPGEPGRGFFLEWQGGQLFMAGYMYDDNGNPVWYLSSNTSSNLQTYGSTWQLYANGQTLTGAFKPAAQVNSNVAPVSITFQGSENAIMTLPGGRTTAIRRFRF